MGTQRPFPKGAQPPIFGPYLLRPNGCMDQDATWYGGRPRPIRVCLRWGPSPLPKKRVEPPNFRPMFIVANGWIYQDGTWHGGRPHLRRLCVRWGPSPLPQKGQSPSPIFGHVYCGQTAAWIKPNGLCVRWGHSPFPKRGWSPKFSAHVYCGQTAGCIKMALGMEVGLIQGDFVLDGDPVPLPKKGAESLPNFRPCLLWPNGCMDQDATWYGGGPWRHCVRWGPSSPRKGHSSPLSFRPMSVVATVAHLSYC